LCVAESAGHLEGQPLALEPWVSELLRLAYFAAASNSLLRQRSVADRKICKTSHQLRSRVR
jgi:hypothetical protein